MKRKEARGRVRRDIIAQDGAEHIQQCQRRVAHPSTTHPLQIFDMVKHPSTGTSCEDDGTKYMMVYVRVHTCRRLQTNRRHEDVHRSRISGEYQYLTLIKTSLALRATKISNS